MADDLGAECLGAYGALDYKTPVLDQMATEGLKFIRAYSTPLCTPTRVQLMTGRYSHRNYTGFRKFPEGEITFGTLLQESGYATCMVGKWQLDRDCAMPHQLGFDEYCLQNNIIPAGEFDRRGFGQGRYWGHPFIVANGELYESEERYGPDMLNEYARDFIRRSKDGPFFLYYPMVLPHAPFEPTPHSPGGDRSGAEVSRLRFFKDMVEYTDHLVGRILAVLEEEGIRENTIVIFTGDNGTTYPVPVTAVSPKGFRRVKGIMGARHLGQLDEGTVPVAMKLLEGPLTRTDRGYVPGGKDLMSERGVHVPLIVDWPKYREPFDRIRHENRGLVDFTDFLTTFVELAEGEAPTDRVQDGVSLVPALKGETGGTDRELVFCHYWGFGRVEAEARTSIRDLRWKLYDDGLLYDLEADLEEKHPLRLDHGDETTMAKRRELQAAMDSILASVD